LNRGLSAVRFADKLQLRVMMTDGSRATSCYRGASDRDQPFDEFMRRSADN
jgi:hypothetical protein